LARYIPKGVGIGDKIPRDIQRWQRNNTEANKDQNKQNQPEPVSKTSPSLFFHNTTHGRTKVKN
jgi:hypothetical protein